MVPGLAPSTFQPPFGAAQCGRSRKMCATWHYVTGCMPERLALDHPCRKCVPLSSFSFTATDVGHNSVQLSHGTTRQLGEGHNSVQLYLRHFRFQAGSFQHSHGTTWQPGEGHHSHRMIWRARVHKRMSERLRQFRPFARPNGDQCARQGSQMGCGTRRCFLVQLVWAQLFFFPFSGAAVNRRPDGWYVCVKENHRRTGKTRAPLADKRRKISETALVPPAPTR